MNQPPIRVLLALDDPELAARLRSLVQKQPDMELVGEVGRIGALEAGVTQHAPDVAVVHAELANGDLLRTLWLLLGRAPNLSVILIGPRPSEEALRQAMRVGVREYLFLPLDEEEFLQTVREVYHRVQEQLAALRARTVPEEELQVRRAYRAAIFGSKGGVGKTTLASNLGVVLASAFRKKTLLVDGDLFFGDLCVQLNLHARYTIVDLIQAGDELEPAMVAQVAARHPSDLRVLCGPPRPELAELITPDHLSQILDVAAQIYDFVIVDCSPSYDERMLRVLDAADVLFLVTTPEVGPLRNLSHFLELMDSLGYGEKRVHIVLNRANSNVGITPEDIERQLKIRVDFRVNSDGRTVVLSVNRGVPLVVAAPTNPVTQEIRRMAETLVREAEERT